MAFQIKYVYDLVDKLSPKLKKIQDNLQRTADSVKNSSNKIVNSFSKIGNKLDSLGKKAGQVGKSLFLKATVPIALLGGSFVKAASDYQESINKVDVAFGSAAGSVKEFAKSAGKNFGIDRGSALDMAAMFGDMSTAMGLSQNTASDLSQKLVGLAGDLASFKNIGVDQATTALAGVFTGETESLKRLGVVMTEANLKQFAQEQGIRKSLKAFTQAEKVLLRYQFVTKMTKNSTGDFLRTNEGFANQMRIMQSRFKDLSITLGTILLPYAIKLVNFVIKLIEKFQNLSPFVQKTILVMAGLAAILSPILIAISLMIPAIGLIGTGIGFLVTAGIALIPVLKTITALLIANPIGLIITSIGLAVSGIFLLKNKLKDLGFTLADIPRLALDSFQRNFPIITKIIQKVIDTVKFAIDKFRQLKEFVKFGGSNKEINNVSKVIETNPINQNPFQIGGGKLDVNFSNMPKGTNTNFTPTPQNNLSVGMMTEWAI